MDLEKKEDQRGFFARAYCEREFRKQGLVSNWVQMNQTLTKKKGALRGLHFQREPRIEAKVVRCLRGAILDVIVDLRQGSSDYGKWLSVELSATNRTMLYIPAGFAHGFQTLVENTELFYMHSEFYSPECEGGILFSDPELEIPWPLPVSDISERDLRLAPLKETKPVIV